MKRTWKVELIVEDNPISNEPWLTDKEILFQFDAPRLAGLKVSSKKATLLLHSPTGVGSEYKYED